ncbi:SLBB domain-containing protein [Roseivirga sp.]|uniref:SLBB domain-containing protein n=1 Tax=Roseivirga sp. TaxID=1964215 RepID=UPI003B8C7950
MIFRQHFLVFLIVLFLIPLQSFSFIQKLDINNITSEQLSIFVNQAQKEGYSIDEYARSKGLSATDITLLKSRITQLNNPQNGSNTSVATVNARTLSTDPALPIVNRPVNTSRSDIFGTNVFNNPDLNFAPSLNIPTPQDYVLGPGDQIIIELWGQTELSNTLTISPDGYIKPNNLGPIYLNGYTIDKAKNIINLQLDKIYDGLIPNENEVATVYSLITLGQIRSINVTIIGEVVSQGNFNLNSLSTVYSALHAAGGPNSNGTYREIQLVRNNKLHSTIDIYDFLTKGIRANDVNLQHNDVIMVKPYGGRVTLRGRVRRSGRFEITKDETLKDVLSYAGGYTQNANRTKALVTRFTQDGTKLITVTAEALNNFKLQDADVVRINAFNNQFLNRVVIEGAVSNAGTYELSEGLTLKGLIQEAGGLRGDAYRDKVFLYRVTKRFEQEIISYNLEDLLNGRTDDPLLKSDDIVEIKSTFGVTEEAYVGIVGEVANPGLYPFLEKITANDLILLAGGMRTNASSIIEVSHLKKQEDGTFNNEIRQIDLANSQTKSEITLSAFDRVYVRQNAGFRANNEVRVTGEVKNPGLFVISSESERVSDIIKRANGLMPSAYAKGAILIRKSELSSQATGLIIDREALQGLRQKILESTGLTINVRDSLTDRLDKISTENYSGVNASLASEVRRRALLSNNPFLGDSSGRLNDLPDYEPVALDLEEILESPGGDADLFLRTGDVISIPAQLETVRVTGEVVSNLLLKHKKGKRFKDYVSETGGYVSTAFRGKSYVQYPNGERSRVRRFLFFKSYPKVLPGSTIVIAKKPQRTPLNLATTVSSIGSVLTLVLLVDRLNN